MCCVQLFVMRRNATIVVRRYFKEPSLFYFACWQASLALSLHCKICWSLNSVILLSVLVLSYNGLYREIGRCPFKLKCVCKGEEKFVCLSTKITRQRSGFHCQKLHNQNCGSECFICSTFLVVIMERWPFYLLQPPLHSHCCELKERTVS